MPYLFREYLYNFKLMAAPLGNQFWKIRSKHGRDKLFATPELLQEAAYEYFEWCDANPWVKKDWVGKDADKVDRELHRPYTISGLCLYLGCNSDYLSHFKKALPPGEEDFHRV